MSVLGSQQICKHVANHRALYKPSHHQGTARYYCAATTHVDCFADFWALRARL